MPSGTFNEIEINNFKYRYRKEFPPDRVILFVNSFKRQQKSGCWIWSLTKDPRGYGKTTYKNKSIRAHRLAYEIFVGLIPPNHDIHHLVENGCTSRACVNPAHLQAVSVDDHKSIEAKARHKTHCPQGHELVGRNLYIFPGADKRACKACRREAMRVVREQERQTRLDNGGFIYRHKRNDGRRKARLMLTHCRRGHEFTEENTRLYQGRRYCKACHAENTLRYYHESKEKPT